ncbi:hypothetical protein [Neobacillus piezotolerans]|uniref:hypothetical protein n=1 Tax=Neobacillus piezotolerans TaxID=2259171 RepID=UPI0015F149B8|nr:hypothetical protein [Neobacillus piezotolerans]
MTMYDIELMVEVKHREIEENAKDAWKYSVLKEEKDLFRFFKKKKPQAKIHDTPCLCEA